MLKDETINLPFEEIDKKKSAKLLSAFIFKLLGLSSKELVTDKGGSMATEIQSVAPILNLT